MPFELLDSISLPGHPAKPNEDAFGFSQTAAVVMDGATPLAEPLMPGQSDPAWLAHFGVELLMRYARSPIDPRLMLNAALNEAERAFVTGRKRPPVATYEIPFASMMFVAARGNGLEALSFGDCTALVRGPGGTVEIIGRAFATRANEAKAVQQLAKSRGLAATGGIDRPQFLPALRHARNRINGEKGPWLFGPDARAADHVATRRVEAPAGTEVLLATDGMLALASDYGRYDVEGLMAAALTKGLAKLGDELRAVEEEDPDGEKYPRFKKSDDATALLLRMS